jgi:hypothetical protein
LRRQASRDPRLGTEESRRRPGLWRRRPGVSALAVSKEGEGEKKQEAPPVREKQRGRDRCVSKREFRGVFYKKLWLKFFPMACNNVCISLCEFEPGL